MNRLTSIAGVLALTACASSGSTPAPREVSGPVEGTYDYIANIPGQQVQGKFNVFGDTIVVLPLTDYCRPVVASPDPLYLRYTCNGPGRYEQLTLTLDRRNPAQFSRWSASFRVQKSRQVCKRYAIQNGQQVCVEQGPENYEATESRSGKLQVRRTP